MDKEYPYYDAAGIGRQVDEVAVLEKMQDNPSFRDDDFTEEELEFIRACRFYFHTATQQEITRLALEREIGERAWFFTISTSDCARGWWGY